MPTDLGGLALEGGGEGVGKQPQVDWQQELHEGDHHKHREGNHAEYVSHRPTELQQQQHIYTFPQYFQSDNHSKTITIPASK